MKNSILVLLAILFCSCNSNLKTELPETETSKMVSTGSMPIPDQQSADANLKLVKTADYRFRVKNINASIEAIELAVRKYPAHISSSNITSEEHSLDGTMTIRVASAYFAELLKDIDREAELVHYRNIRTEDVGKQFVDLEARLKIKREVQKRYEEILRKKAGTIEELLAAEKQIGELQEEIEATIGKLNYLKDQVSLSTIQLQLYQNITENLVADSDENILSQFGEAFMNGMTGTVQILVALTHVWPILLIVVFSYFIYRRKSKAETFVEKV